MHQYDNTNKPERKKSILGVLKSILVTFPYFLSLPIIL
ncbi:hypothetical protein GM3709_3018 [Geminocystis sp. NIES-3709]|nr:hypothetical protein GM3709_3018 [Geminocystis sp. NIES-3709]